MAVETAAADRGQSGSAPSSAISKPGDCGRVTRVTVTLLAQIRRAVFQQIRDDGPVRVVTDGAIFRDRLVVMHKGTTLLHMTGVTSLVHAVAFKLLRSSGTVWVVAVRATHLPFQDRVARGTMQLGALLLVAGETNLRLGFPVAGAVVLSVYLMAVGTGDVPIRVGARPPEHLPATLMAAEAGLVTLDHGR